MFVVQHRQLRRK